ncbi:hypothetical protein [Halogeometricum luteum]|uniref:Uncharacterized protein n=1 Tax=Halogeometricum luteum TaxID=2950537 RepID=A0ABU2FY12_9EURY|nr:hypothetical protein [Halogeometricum sp. S3BR5-2]MDS0292899.1 hypothetical protein [Halogeometricum sp. S3BR5-2]
MRPRDAVRRAAGYHLRALPPTLAGLAVAGTGVWYGVGAGAGASAATLAAGGRLVPAAGLVLVGTAVAAVGRTAVRIDATAAAVSEAAGEGALDEDDLRQTVAIATDRAVAASFEGAAAEIEARVVDAVDRAASETDPSPDARARTDSGGGDAPRADALGAFAASDRAEPNALADAIRRASERVESYLAAEDGDGDAAAFRGLAEGAAVLDDESDDAGGDAESGVPGVPVASEDAAPADGAEILDGDRSGGGLPDGTGRGDDAVIIDGPDVGADADTNADADADDGGEMVFGGAVRDPESDAA